MDTKIKLIFKIKNQYGNLRYFPDCDNAKKLIKCYRGSVKCLTVNELEKLLDTNFFNCEFTLEGK